MSPIVTRGGGQVQPGATDWLLAGPDEDVMPSMLRSCTLLSLLSVLVAQENRPLPELADATRIVATADLRPLDWPALLAELARADVVFLGETHVDDTTHRAELAVLEGLLERRGGKVVLSLEMFERDVQPAVDDWLADRIDEPTFLQRSRPWGNYHTAYRPLLLAAKAAKIPVIAANFPVMLRRKLGSGGKAAFDALTADERAFVPTEIFPASAAYWERVDRAVRGHMGMGGGSDGDRLYDGQNLWDNAMGDAVAKARAAHPEAVVLHVAGGFHVAYRDGTVAQFARRSQGSKAVVVAIAPVPDLHAAHPARDRERADHIIYARTLARDFHDGTYAVEVPAEVRYLLATPHDVTAAPLLIWLPDRGTRPEDAFAFWRQAIGKHAAVAVLEHPFPETQDDLARGGRYVAGDSFRGDYSRITHALERIVEHITRRQAVDPQRILIAGAGDAGAVVLWAALYSEWLGVDMIAFDPNDLTRLGMEALPDQKPAARSLRLLGTTVAKERLDGVAADYQKLGVTTTVAAIDRSSVARVDAVGAALLLPANPTGPADRVVLQLENDLPRAREWAELHAQRLRHDGKSVTVTTTVPAATPSEQVRKLRVGGDGAFPLTVFADGKGLPLAGGPFGGTTIVVLPAGISDAEAAAWQELEKSRAIKKRSMFANLSIARQDGSPSVAELLQQLRQRGRSRMLIVPAMFCADAATMQALRAQVGDAGAGLDLAWLPGLGAELAK
ncbi:MAG: ChaN family lipoprotein [Planctomycetes bacterium]|nr:ChaN family lipoprotein [Planctomycetota bacterium]